MHVRMRRVLGVLAAGMLSLTMTGVGVARADAAPLDEPDLSISAVTENSITVTWALPADPDDEISAVKWSWRGDDGTTWEKKYDVNEPGIASPFKLTGMRPETTYTIKLQAFVGNTGGAIASRSATTDPDFGNPGDVVPGPPDLFVDSVSAHSVELLWVAPVDEGSDPITGYRLSWAGESVLILADEAPPYVVSGLEPDTRYTFTLRAISDAGEGAPTSVTVRTDAENNPDPVTRPGRVSNVHAVGKVKSAVITWQPPRNDGGAQVSGYRVNIRQGTHQYKPITLSSVKRKLTITGMPAGKFRLAIQAKNRVGWGPLTAVRVTVRAGAGSGGGGGGAGGGGGGGGGGGPVRDYANCDAMHRDYPHGVGRPGARDHTSGDPVTNFAVNAEVYRLNTESDADHDGIACEAH